jgi:hypothetical protein
MNTRPKKIITSPFGSARQNRSPKKINADNAGGLFNRDDGGYDEISLFSTNQNESSPFEEAKKMDGGRVISPFGSQYIIGTPMGSIDAFHR